MAHTANEPQPQGSAPDARTCTSGGVIEIRVAGHLDNSWSSWLGGLDVRLAEGGETLLIGPVADQAALLGILEMLYRSNIRLVSVNPLSCSASGAPDKGTGGEPDERTEVP